MCAASARWRCSWLAASQHSAFGARTAGRRSRESRTKPGRGRIRSGTWLEPIPGVLVVAAAPRTWQQRLMIPTLIRPGGVVVSHLSAARLHGLDGFTESSVSDCGCLGPFPTIPGVIVHRDGVWDQAITPPGRQPPLHEHRGTLCDLGAVVRNDDRIEQALDDALGGGRASGGSARPGSGRPPWPLWHGPAPAGPRPPRSAAAFALPNSMFERIVDRACKRLPPPVRQLEGPRGRWHTHRLPRRGRPRRCSGSRRRACAGTGIRRASARRRARHVAQETGLAHRVPNVGGGAHAHRVRLDAGVDLPRPSSSLAKRRERQCRCWPNQSSVRVHASSADAA